MKRKDKRKQRDYNVLSSFKREISLMTKVVKSKKAYSRKGRKNVVYE